MTTIPQAVSIGLFLVVALMAASVARAHQRRREERPEAAQAARMFALFWAALSAEAVIGALQILLAIAGIASAGAAFAVSGVSFFTICLMMWGLLSYLLFLFTGRPGGRTVVGILYLFVFLASIGFLVGFHATGITAVRWGSRIDFADAPGGLANAFLGIAFLLPPIVGALAYGTLAFRVPTRTQRYRIVLVSGGILVWFLVSLVLGAPALADNDVAQGLGRALTFASILAIVFAYSPPAWVQRRFGIEALSTDVGAPPEPPGVREERRQKLDRRLRDLV